MNKKTIADIIHRNISKQTVRIMRTTLFLLLCTFMFSQAANSYSQVFDFNLKSTSIKEVCKEIERKSDYIFVFSDNSEKMINKKIDLKANKENVVDLLESLLSIQVWRTRFWTSRL